MMVNWRDYERIRARRRRQVRNALIVHTVLLVGLLAGAVLTIRWIEPWF